MPGCVLKSSTSSTERGRLRPLRSENFVRHMGVCSSSDAAQLRPNYGLDLGVGAGLVLMKSSHARSMS